MNLTDTVSMMNSFTPKCSLELLKEQKKHMGLYLNCLEIRAEIEGIEL